MFWNLVDLHYFIFHFKIDPKTLSLLKRRNISLWYCCTKSKQPVLWGKHFLGCITIICQRLNGGMQCVTKTQNEGQTRTIHPVNLKCGGIQPCSINKPCSNLKIMILHFWYKWLSTKILWYNHICVGSRNLSLKLDPGKEYLNIWDICMYIYGIYVYIYIYQSYLFISCYCSLKS